jgi:recombination protein RecT
MPRMVRPNQYLHTRPEPAQPGLPIARSGWLKGVEKFFSENDAPYGELELVNPDAQSRQSLDWQSEKPVSLLRNLLRLTAPNPGVMTGPGTNSYVLGDRQTGFLVIDPGPDEPAHIERLWQTTAGDIRMIVCTHSHADHSPAAKPLQALCARQGRSPPILGLPSAATARPAAHFIPDRTLSNEELLQLGSTAEGVTHTLKVSYTPGHAANHLCLILLEDGLLFSGDHILNGSTTVIDPPDGNMSDYLNSLDTLSALCALHNLAYILPAHGHVLGRPAHAIAQLKAHRLKREAKVLLAMQAKPQGNMDDWVALAYDDVSPQLWPMAKRSMLAHVERLRG